MRKIFIATGVILSFLVVTNLQSYAEDVIYGCVDEKGKIRVVGSPDECKKRETEISWNETKPSLFNLCNLKHPKQGYFQNL